MNSTTMSFFSAWPRKLKTCGLQGSEDITLISFSSFFICSDLVDDVDDDGDGDGGDNDNDDGVLMATTL